MFDANPWLAALARPRGTLVVVLAAALVLALLPRRAIEPLSRTYDRVLEPGRSAADYACDGGANLVAHVRHWSATASEVATLAAEASQLRARNRELELALQLAKTQRGDCDRSGAPGDPLPLVAPEAIRARVLGRLARAALAADQILDVGREAGAQSGALALVDSTLAIDLGRQADVATGDIALCGRRVFGKITEVGAQTSIVRRASEPGYRDVVQLAQSVDGVLHFGPRGLFEGTGEPKARIRQVSATEKVEKGWLVFTTGHAGLSPQPLLYGVVARAERQPGAAHWEISVDLAAGADDPTHLLVLRARVNPARLAGAETEAQ